MRITVAVLARNEGGTISTMLAGLARQSFLAEGHSVEIVVYANNCSDDTAEQANSAFAAHFRSFPVKTRAVSTSEGGKTRAWNAVVHSVADPLTDLFVFCDGDIAFARTDAVAEMIALWSGSEEVRAVTGNLLKNIHQKPNKNLLDHASLTLSTAARLPNALNGSLYVIGGEEARKIWLPVPLPGEDGFLSAMIKTNGFTEQPVEGRVVSPCRTTHFYEAHSLRGYFRHEKRITMGTTINGWLCEELWSLELTEHAGSLIRQRNSETPGWVADVMRRKMNGRSWVVPARLLTWRLGHIGKLPLREAAIRLPLALGATVLNIVPSVTANKELKRDQAAGFW